MSSLQCSEELRSEMSLNDGVSCALKVQCSAELELEKQVKGVAENLKSMDQCSILKYKCVCRKLGRFFSRALEVLSATCIACEKVRSIM